MSSYISKGATISACGRYRYRLWREWRGTGTDANWEWTGSRIFENGAPVPRDKTYTYLASVWATPELCLDGEIIDCWKYTDENDPNQWNSETYWPEFALAILNS